ncbi:MULTISPECIES: DUF3800 domain-containing protein [Lysobacter]|uniref:DUF3800 domain-containing protein n=1 Tax=Lysobacter TaxID=68 RepID=UPI001F23AF88|nr:MULTISPECIES: DUF3800 domain-containing protein [Lysobacter]UJB19226.1 DUF3800 domain-containing protein [Lysobacter capsici]UJQ27049.1 DUF3800 domain-containing protein [Lysobacter gummosus]
MFIYIDESGVFVPSSSANSWNVIAAYTMPEAARKQAESALRKLKVDSGRSHSEEIKLKDLTEAQLTTFLDKLGRLGAVVFASCIDLGAQDPAAIAAHQANQVKEIRANGSRMVYEEGRALIEDLAGRVERLSPQLYTQMVVQLDLIDQVYRATTLYFVQRIPATLSSFRWRIDEKNSCRPVFEETLRHLAPPLLQSKSLRDPAIFVREFDYSHYEQAFRYAPGEMPTYLQEETGIEVESGSNLGKILRDFEFVRSHEVPGVQIAGILASSFSRVLRGNFKDNLSIARKLGQLTVQRAQPQPSIHLISLSEDQYAEGRAADVARTVKMAAREMFR